MIDIIVVGLTLPLSLPIMGLIGLSIWLTLGRPILFSQDRPGLAAKPFKIFKFRSMISGWNASGQLLPDGDRITSLGYLLRSISLDELPELFNVLKGDMSLVGPRPLLMQYLPRYNSHQKRRHEVRPGITGLTQVCGRNAITWEEKFDLDVWYVDHVSFWLDLQILALTVWKILKREGISQPGHATMEEFLGSRNR